MLILFIALIIILVLIFFILLLCFGTNFYKNIFTKIIVKFKNYLKKKKLKFIELKNKKKNIPDVY
jgi:hypothetical protein